MPKSKLSALASLLLVFLSGAVLGAFAHRLYMVRSVSSNGPVALPGNRRPDPEEIRKHLVAEMRDVVKLDDQQVSQLNKIYDETREKSDEVRQKANAEMRVVWDSQVEQIKAILRPEQVTLYDQLRAKHDAERRQHRQGPPPPPAEKH